MFNTELLTSTFADFEAAIERVVGRLEQRSRVMNPKQRETARDAGPRLQHIGGAVNEDSHSSAETRETIDAEVRRIVGEQFARAEALLNLHRGALTRLAADLL